MQTYYIEGSGTNDQIFMDLPYTNYEVRLLSDSELTVNNAANFFNGATSKLVYLALMVGIIFLIYAFVRGLSK